MRNGEYVCTNTSCNLKDKKSKFEPVLKRFKFVLFATTIFLLGMPLFAMANSTTAELTKIVRTPANEPTPDLTFTFRIERISFNGNPDLYHQIPQIGTVVDGVGTVELTINAANGSPSTSGDTTTLTRTINLLEGMTFTSPGVFVWHVSKIAESSGVNADPTRSNIEYSDALYELRVEVTGSGATATVITNLVAIIEDQTATEGTPMYSWGRNNTGQLGLPTSPNRPTRVGERDNWVHVSSAGNGSAAINAEGHLYVWGNARNHASMGRPLESGSANITTPERLLMPGEAEAVAAGGNYHRWVAADVAGTTAGTRMFVINDQGQLWAWGMNAAGQLGDGTTNNRRTPFRVRVPGEVASGEDYVWSSVSTASFNPGTSARRCFTMAITEDGRLYSWGNNATSQLGRSAGAGNSLPGPVNMAASVGGNPGTNRWKVARAAGDATAFAIGVNGQLYSWGNNSGDQLGRAGGTTATPTRVTTDAPAANPPVPGWADVIQQVNSPQVTVALTTDGRIFSWAGGTGNPVSGLGRPGGPAGSATRTNRPGQIGTADNWVTIGGGNLHSIAINSDGRLYSWGVNNYGQLGLGHTGTPPAAGAGPSFVRQTYGLAGFSQSGSGYHSMVLIRTDPMVFTSIYTVADQPDPITTNADLTKVLRLPTGIDGLNRSFTFHIERYSYNGNDANYSQIPLIGTVVPSNSRTESIVMPVNSSNSTVAVAGEFTTFTRTINILDGIQFDRAGTFVWHITEVEDSSGTTWPSVIDYSQAAYELRVIVTQPGGTAASPLVATTVIVQLLNDDGTLAAGIPERPSMAFANVYDRHPLPTGVSMNSVSYLPFVSAAGFTLAFVARKKRRAIEQLPLEKSIAA